MSNPKVTILMITCRPDEAYLELKSRTWSKQDAVQKAGMISELLDVLGVDKEGLVPDEYAAF